LPDPHTAPRTRHAYGREWVLANAQLGTAIVPLRSTEFAIGQNISAPVAIGKIDNFVLGLPRLFPPEPVLTERDDLLGQISIA
jgi:hypothetical protein